MKDGLGMNHKEMGDVFKQWKSGVLDSYLIDITTDIVSLSLMIQIWANYGKMYFDDDDGKACTPLTLGSQLMVDSPWWRRYLTRRARRALER
jgi:hypothetical protein